MKALALIGVGALAQLLLGRAVPSAWLVPDLIMASLVIAVAVEPDRRFVLVAWAAWLAVLFSLRQPLGVAGAYLAAGWVIVMLASLWDLTALPVQRLVVGSAEALLVLVWMLPQGGQGQGLELVGLGAARLLITVVCLPLVRAASRVLWRDAAV